MIAFGMALASEKVSQQQRVQYSLWAATEMNDIRGLLGNEGFTLNPPKMGKSSSLESPEFPSCRTSSMQTSSLLIVGPGVKAWVKCNMAMCITIPGFEISCEVMGLLSGFELPSNPSFCDNLSRLRVVSFLIESAPHSVEQKIGDHWHWLAWLAPHWAVNLHPGLQVPCRSCQLFFLWWYPTTNLETPWFVILQA